MACPALKARKKSKEGSVKEVGCVALISKSNVPQLKALNTTEIKNCERVNLGPMLCDDLK